MSEHVADELLLALGPEATAIVARWLAKVVEDHSLCVNEGMSSERVIPPSVAWLAEAVEVVVMDRA